MEDWNDKGEWEKADSWRDRGAEWRRIDCFFFNDTATTEIYTLSLHDALPICSFQCNLLLRR